MSEPESPPPESNSAGKPSRRARGKDPKRPERQSSNTFWYLMLGLVVAAVVVSFMNPQRRGQKLKYSELVQGIESGRFTAGNVHELTIGEKYITFRDQPASPSAAAEASDQPVNNYHVPAIGMTEGQKEALEELAGRQNPPIPVGFDEPPSEWQSAVVFLLPIALIIVFFLFIFRRMGGAGSAMSFGRSRGKLYAQQDIEITFEDVAGIDEAVEELREVVEFLRSPGKYQALGGRIPRGVLLVGPPGTGKTLLAKAVAGEAGVGFFSLSGSDFVEMFVGVGAARVRDMFQQAGAKSPSIIFIDELDALGKVRGSGMPGGHDEREQTLNALLVEMDGFSSDQSVIVMGATNRPETLDPALMRPGRFDRHVLVDRPDIKGRESILKVHAARIKMDDSVDLKYIARLTPGFVGADLANLVNEGALLAARAGKNRVSMKEFEDGIERVVAGLEKTTRIIHEDTKQRVAYHECGHALVACCLPNTDPVHKISIIPRGMGALGYTLQRPEDDRHLMTQSELENRICVLMGGTVAEELVYQELSTGAQNDLQRATDIARRMVTEFGMSPKLGRVHYSERQRSPFLSESSMPADHQHSERTMREIDVEVKRVLDEAIQTVRDILSTRRDVLEHMTRDLIEMETMGADHLKRILEEHKTSPQIKPGTFAMPSTAVPRRLRRTEPEPREIVAEPADGA